jgi:hypothetical protein
MILPLPYPWNAIVVTVIVFGFAALYWVYYFKHRPRRPDVSPEIPAMEYFATGLNINRVKLIIDGEEPFELRGVLIRNVEDNMFSISISGDLKDGYQAY